MPQSYHQARFPSAARSLQRKDGLLGSDLGRNWFHDDKQIYHVSGLSPTPSLVEHAPSTEGSPESYHPIVVLCWAAKSQETGKRREHGLETDQVKTVPFPIKLSKFLPATSVVWSSQDQNFCNVSLYSATLATFEATSWLRRRRPCNLHISCYRPNLKTQKTTL